MKRILCLVFILVIMFNGVSSAKFTKNYHEAGFTLQSICSVKYTECNSIDIKAMFFLSRNFFNDGKERSCLIITKDISTVGKSEIKKKYNNIMLTMKNPPKFEIYKKNVIENIMFKKALRIDTSSIEFEVFDEDLEPFKQADKIVIILPMQDGSELRIELPEKLVSEWKYIINTTYEEEESKKE